jgi:Rrf2 family protein
MLKASTRARYSLRAMIELALHEGSGPLLLRELAAAQHISLKYLEQLTIPLRRAGLVQTERGPQGGYELARPAAEITVMEIIQAVEGPLELLDCMSRPTSCERATACAARDLWTKVNDAIGAVLSRTTLADLRDEQLAAEAARALVYQI